MLRRICAFLLFSGSSALVFLFLTGCSSNFKTATSPATPSGPGGAGGTGGGGTGGGGTGGGGTGAGGTGGGGTGGGTGGGSGSGSGSSSPTVAAYVYVSNSQADNNQYQIAAYSADANGQLTPVAGSPFNDDVGGLAVNGAYLMGETAAATSSTGTVSNNYVNAYKIASDGSLTAAAQTNVDQFGSGCGINTGILFDRTGQTLYAIEDNIDCASNKGVASFSLDSSTGSLTYLGDVNIGNFSPYGVSFTGTDAYAYTALPGCMYPHFATLQRTSTGMLNLAPNLAGSAPPPPAPPPGVAHGTFVNGYVPGQSAADSSNHIVFAEFPCFGQGGPTQTQLATYSVDSSGNLTTTDTYATMPTAPVLTSVEGKLAISPSDKFLAVADYGGLQIYHFNGSGPVTTDTGVLTTDGISAIGWDKNDHLYAITGTVPASSRSAPTNPNKLYVFTVTATSVTQAPGSPYTIAFPAGIAVQSK